MFCYQNNKLYSVGKNNELVGVNITPTGVSAVKEKTKYIDGYLMTTHEVYCAFGIYRGLSYKFPVKEEVNPETPAEKK